MPDLEPTQIAALAATTLAVASRASLATGRGQFRETVARGTDGYLAVYAAGPGAVVAVIGTTRLNVGSVTVPITQSRRRTPSTLRRDSRRPWPLTAR